MRRYYEALAPPSHRSMINLSPMHSSAPSPHRVPCCAGKDTPSVCQRTIKLVPTDNPTKRKPSKSQRDQSSAELRGYRREASTPDQEAEAGRLMPMAHSCRMGFCARARPNQCDRKAQCKAHACGTFAGYVMCMHRAGLCRRASHQAQHGRSKEHPL